MSQIDSVLGDIGADAVKTGMLPSQAIVKLVADKVHTHTHAHTHTRLCSNTFLSILPVCIGLGQEIQGCVCLCVCVCVCVCYIGTAVQRALVSG